MRLTGGRGHYIDFLLILGVSAISNVLRQCQYWTSRVPRHWHWSLVAIWGHMSMDSLNAGYSLVHDRTNALRQFLAFILPPENASSIN